MASWQLTVDLLPGNLASATLFSGFLSNGTTPRFTPQYLLQVFMRILGSDITGAGFSGCVVIVVVVER